MVHARRRFGTSAEKLAANYLKEKGYHILEHQYRIREGEIDLIAKHGDEIVFVEVKARSTTQFGFPEESVTQSKLRKIERVAERYLQGKHFDGPYRIDVVTIEIKENEVHIRHLESVG